jgi:monovalent cation:H+ antiporter-2, CPA2 family
LLKGIASTVLVVWLLVLLPFGVSLIWISLAILAILGLLAAVFWRRLVLWHSRLEIELHAQLKSAFGSDSPHHLSQALQQRQDDWGLQAEEFIIPHSADCIGRPIGELAIRQRFGSSIASIDRQGYIITNPSAQIVLYPGDKLLLLGSPTQLEETLRELNTTRRNGPSQQLEEQGLEVVTVPPGSPSAGKTLLELDPIRNIGVQVAGIGRNHQRLLTPTGDDRIFAGDELLVLGTPRQIQDFREWLTPPAPEDLPVDPLPTA